MKSRSIWVAGAVMLGTTFMTSARTSEGADRLRFLVKGGVNWARADVSGTDEFDIDARAGALIGAGVSIPLNDWLALQPEAHFTQLKFSSTDFEQSAELDTRGVDVPVLLVAELSRETTVRPFVLAGPRFSFIGDATQTFGGETTDISDEIGDSDVGLVVGAGVTIGRSRTRASIELRYSRGFVNLDPKEENELKARSIKLLFGIGF